MAAPVLTNPQLARIWINATAPGVPAAAKKLCAINSKAFNQTINLQETVVPDCDNPLLVSMVKRTPVSKDWNITGTGAFELDLRDELQAIVDGVVSVPVVYEYLAPATPAGYYKGNAFLATYNQVANQADGYITVDLDFRGDGLATWVPTP